jgi:hypothetical protein
MEEKEDESATTITTASSSSSLSATSKEAHCCTSIVQEIIQHVIHPFVSKTPEMFRYKGTVRKIR